MTLSDLRQKLEQIQLPDLREIDKQIAAANDATTAHQTRVAAFDIAFGILKTTLGVIL